MGTIQKVKQRRWRRRLIGTAIGLLTGLLLAEALLRVIGYSPAHVNPLHAFHRPDPVLVYRGRPNVEGRFRRDQFDVVVRHNERGFRMPEFSRNPSKMQGTVHVFGDSFTWGWGVETGEVFTDKLRHAMPNHSVRNYGINGSGTALQVALLESEVKAEVRPGDHIVLMFFYNDYFDNRQVKRLHGRIEGDRVIEVRPGGDFGSPGGWFKEHSYLINFAAHVWDRQKASQRAAAERAHASPRGTGPSPAHQRIARHYLTRFHDLCKQCKAELTVVWVPDSRDLLARTAGQPIGYFDAFAELVRGLGLELVDPIDALVAAGRNGPAVYFEDDDHWTPAGHATIAEVLAEQLK